MNRFASAALLLAVGCHGASTPSSSDAGLDLSVAMTGDLYESADLEPPDDLSPEPDLAKVAAYNPCPKTGTCKVMPLGDSITFGYQSSTGGGYRVELFHDALAAKKTITFVGNSSSGPDMVDNVTFPKANEGHSGYTIEDSSSRSGIEELTAASLTKNTPHIVTLMIGTNDVDTNNDLANAPARFGTLLDLIFSTSPDVLVIAAKITPTKSATENMLVETYNAGVAAQVATRQAAGKHIVLVDMYATFMADKTYTTDYMTDNLHPNDTGYAKMGDVWYAAMSSVLP